MRQALRNFILLLASPLLLSACHNGHTQQQNNNQPILSAFYYLAQQPIDETTLDQHNKAIAHLDILNYSVLLISDDSTLPVSKTNGDNLTLIHQWIKQNKLHTKVIASIGHWENKAADQIFLDAKTRQRFVNSVVNMLSNNDYGLSGINIDWENFFDNDLVDVKAFPTLIKDLRQAMNKAGLQNDYITLDLPVGVKFAKRYPAPSKWAQYVSWANVMSYTFYGGVIPYAELDATLGKVTAPYGGPKPSYKTISIVNTLNYYHQHGLSNNKTVIALPAYGVMNTIYNGDKKHHYGLRQAVVKIKHNHIPVVNYPYHDCYERYGTYHHAKIKSSIHQYTFSKPASIINAHSYWVTVRHKDKRVKRKTYQFISYPDPLYIKQTAAYLIKNHYHGISMWTLNYDIPYSNPDSLLHNAYNVIHKKRDK
ncbi:MAG: glycoside hydrolase family 18 protein [Coxiellaceae bacterium]|nr:glycoside hydrolase family 18 protein [Coxiellaceae bacterium]